jgi:protein-tyrosine-phosphatase/DNA-binding transcriptional ArsR family regulator
MDYRPSILFLCTGNSARSQLAEALMRHHAGDRFEVFSAGTRPQPVDPRVSEVLLTQHIDHAQLISKSLEQLEHDHDFDYVITLCDGARQECELLPHHGISMHWDIPDPKQLLGITPFEQTFADLDERITLFTQLNSNQNEPIAISPTRVFKALSDSLRLAVLLLIEEEHELCVFELVEALAQSQPKISRHLATLRDSGLVTVRKQGSWVYYAMAPNLPNWINHVLRTTRLGNPAYIHNPQRRLAAMTDRPSRRSRESNGNT